MSNPLLSRLGLSKPIVQAPMAGVSTPAMAAAVSNAGALGSLGLGAMSPLEAAAAIQSTRKLTSMPFAVNFFCHRPAVADTRRDAEWLHWLTPQFARFGAEPPSALREIYSSFLVDCGMLDVVVRETPAVVSFHFGLPPPDVIAALKECGILLMATATSQREADVIENAGIDVIVAQGCEAGGHRGVFDPAAVDDELGTLALTRMLVTASSLPVIAAGGIMDGAGIAAAVAADACAAQLGTAYVACSESAIDAGYRHALLSGARATVFTTSISGRKARCLVNEFTRLDSQGDRPQPPSYPIAYDAGKALHAAAKSRGEYGYGPQWAGRGVTRVRAMSSASLTEALNAEYEALLPNGIPLSSPP